SVTEGLHSCTGWETFGPSWWPGLETGPQRGSTRGGVVGLLRRPTLQTNVLPLVFWQFLL
ncbi:MAG TPA: hypothetical protein VE999_08465, partial [Gemmataceae bacterium]|nr:hypothetical protein [Gemmataceae bacterium]